MYPIASTLRIIEAAVFDKDEVETFCVQCIVLYCTVLCAMTMMTVACCISCSVQVLLAAVSNQLYGLRHNTTIVFPSPRRQGVKLAAILN